MIDQSVAPIHETLSIDIDQTASPLAGDQWLDELADGLTEHGWMTLDAGCRLSTELLRGLRGEVQILDRTEALRKAGVGRGSGLLTDRSVRRDKIAWLQGVTPVQAELFAFFESVRLGLNQRLFLGLKRFEAHYATYHSGDFYRRHVDSFRGRASRVVSLVLYLNESWQQTDGGVLRVYNRENENEVCGTVLPQEGRMTLFMSEEIPHEVLPANRTRYSVACWFRCDEVPLPL
ncbi:2OG-Fe(II) oxygenase [Marinobacter sp. 71-i]|uniref:2OG-Fe(II) oxygenase n=1 Tax=Marinobacter iranensis TaxID=2962607 RepID=A0ABT5YA32_9GAMM|nr:2OG-Fe(II) oxygenase [Marinobacter iranensis]MDF0750447.1 2OG-Fe(II) oxygenase [Marinobacter iranensis]